MTAAAHVGLTPEETKRRRGWLGATDIAPILGLHPYRTIHDVWMEKMGYVESSAGNQYTEWGQRLEPMIAQKYADETGYGVELGRLMVHSEHDWARATPDRFVWKGSEKEDRHLLEVKTVGARQAYRWEDGAYPDEYDIQCRWQMFVCNMERVDIAALIGGNDYQVRTVHRDRGLEQDIFEAARHFWCDCVQKDEPPSLDGSWSAREMMLKRYPLEKSQMKQATAEAETWADLLRFARRAEKTAQHTRVHAENELRAIIGDAEGVEGAFGAITWRTARSSKSVDWECMARELCAVGQLDIQEWSRRHTVITPGTRRFVVPREWNRDE